MQTDIFDIYEALEDVIELPQELDDINTYREELLGVLEHVGMTMIDTLIVDSLCNFHKNRIEGTIHNVENVDEILHTEPMHTEPIQELSQPIELLKEYPPNPKWMTEVLTRDSVEQRSEDWYKQAANMVTASEFCSILKPGRTRGRVVLSKVNPQPRPPSRPVPSEMMTPFDWGIRFEPVIKQIYEHKYNCKIIDVGRLVHPTDPKVGASPDGIVTGGEKNGRLIEIKCPITREVGKSIPEEYQIQMQLQLEVTGADKCDYVECTLRSAGGRKIQTGPALMSGIMWRVSKGTEEEKYIYGPIGGTVEVEPMLEEDEHVLEVIPWELVEYVEIEVKNSPNWWLSVQPVLKEFWQDVEKAREGTFVLPESKRAAPKKKEDMAGKCMF